MSLVIVHGVASCAALALFLWLARSRAGVGWVAGLSLAGVFVGGALMLGGFALHMLATFVVALLCIPLAAHRGLVAALLIGAPLLVYGSVVPDMVRRLRALDELRRDFPVESLAGRLDYEHGRTGPCGCDDSSSPELAPDVEQNLAGFEQSRELADWSYNRVNMLRRLHSETQENFILATGFGPVRMMGLTRRDEIELPDTRPIPVEVSPSQLPPGPSDISASDELAAGCAAEMPSAHEESLARLHRSGRDDLFDRARMGYVQDVHHVAGFQSHRFTKMPEADTGPWRREWKLARLELIGLLKYDEPRAYVSEFLPRLDELGEKATRDLDAFERMALDELRTERDVVVDEKPDRIRMAGSLRAGNDCLQCHAVKRGELIGVLSYDLVPVKSQQLSQK